MPNPTGPVALVIDNDTRLAGAVAKRLRAAGIRCVTAVNGAQGIALFDKEYFSVVLTDLVMPQGDGLSVIDSIRRQSDVPIIVMTGYSDLFHHDRGDTERVAYLSKPFDQGELMTCINEALGTPEEPKAA